MSPCRAHARPGAPATHAQADPALAEVETDAGRDPAALVGRQRKKCAATFQEARDRKSELRSAVRRGDYDTAASSVGFEDYARTWIATYAGRTKRGVREITRDDYRRALGLNENGEATGAGAVAFFGNRKLAGIRPKDVKDLIAHVQARGVSRNTVRLALAPVKAMLADAFEEGTIQRNPAQGVRIGRIVADSDTAQERRALSPDELGRVLGAIPEQHRLLVRFLAVTGLRIGEAIGLRWQDVDANAVHVRRRYYRGGFSEPKSSSGRRTVPLAPAVAQELWKHRKASRYAADSDLVFANERGGPLHSSNYSRRILKPAVEAASVPWATGFHVYRHTCASFLFRQKEQGGAGMSVRQVQEWLGHSSPTLTLSIYIHLIPGELTAPAELDAMLPLSCPRPKPSPGRKTEPSHLQAFSSAGP